MGRFGLDVQAVMLGWDKRFVRLRWSDNRERGRYHKEKRGHK